MFHQGGASQAGRQGCLGIGVLAVGTHPNSRTLTGGTQQSGTYQTRPNMNLLYLFPFFTLSNPTQRRPQTQT